MPALKSRYLELSAAAKVAQKNAYAPYSKYYVGAAVLAKSGQIYSACNVENASYGLSQCAERNAIAKAISEGEKGILAVAVVVRGSKPASPCGACRQWIFELGGANAEVLMLSEKGAKARAKIGSLLPLAFGKGHMQ